MARAFSEQIKTSIGLAKEEAQKKLTVKLGKIVGEGKANYRYDVVINGELIPEVSDPSRTEPKYTDGTAVNIIIPFGNESARYISDKADYTLPEQTISYMSTKKKERAIILSYFVYVVDYGSKLLHKFDLEGSYIESVNVSDVNLMEFHFNKERHQIRTGNKHYLVKKYLTDTSHTCIDVYDNGIFTKSIFPDLMHDKSAMFTQIAEAMDGTGNLYILSGYSSSTYRVQPKIYRLNKDGEVLNSFVVNPDVPNNTWHTNTNGLVQTSNGNLWTFDEGWDYSNFIIHSAEGNFIRSFSLSENSIGASMLQDKTSNNVWWIGSYNSNCIMLISEYGVILKKIQPETGIAFSIFGEPETRNSFLINENGIYIRITKYQSANERYPGFRLYSPEGSILAEVILNNLNLRAYYSIDYNRENKNVYILIYDYYSNVVKEVREYTFDLQYVRTFSLPSGSGSGYFNQPIEVHYLS